MKQIYKTIQKKILRDEDATCGKLHAASNDIAAMLAETHVHEMGGEADGDCPCSGGAAGGGSGGESNLVDLFILVDSSGSMSNAWAAIADAYEGALEKAKDECGKDVKAHALFIDRQPNNSASYPLGGAPLFNLSHEDYLLNVDSSISNADFRGENSDAPYSQGNRAEQGAEAMIDLIKYNSWREGACRAILYVSDEWLDGSGATRVDSQARSEARTKELVSAANAAGVTLFAHHLFTGGEGYSWGHSNEPGSAQLYEDFTAQTNGALVSGGEPTVELYTELLVKAVCTSCANAVSRCASVDYPKIEPCVHVNWGASDCDKIESHDDEVISVTLCNCYDNATFKNVTMAYAVVVDENGDLPPLLPDGSPSVHVYPTGPVCFGDIGPCADGEETCVSRQFVMINRGAVAGKYTLKLGGICFDVCHGYQASAERIFEICKD